MKNTHKFELGKVYKATDGKRYKCVDLFGINSVGLAPMKGCVVFKKDAKNYKTRINKATNRQCVKISSRGAYIWVSA